MFFWMTLLTFLSSILIYALYPRNDGIKIMDKPLAEIIVSDILVQHLANAQAADYLNVQADGSRLKGYQQAFAQMQANSESISTPYTMPSIVSGNTVFNPNAFTFKPQGYTFQETPILDLPLSKIFCIDNQSGNLTENCGITQGTNTTSDFLITYAPAPADFGTYIENLATRSLGEKMFLADYDANTHLKTNCGIVMYKQQIASDKKDYDGQSHYVLNNTRYDTVRIPRKIMEYIALPANRPLMMCVTPLSVTYTWESNANGQMTRQMVYPQGL